MITGTEISSFRMSEQYAVSRTSWSKFKTNSFLLLPKRIWTTGH